MKTCIKAAPALAAAFCFLPFIPHPAKAEGLYINVPVGQAQGTLTAPSAKESAEELKKIPGGADVVPAEAYKDGYALTMKDMLSTTPGVFAQPRYGEESRLSIRGSGLSRSVHLRGINLLQDGIPFNFADGSGDFQQIDPLAIDHLEIFRGGQALQYGASSLGGAINMITPTAHTVDYDHALMRIEGGSYDTLRMHAEAAQVFSGTDAYAALTRSIADGYRAQSEQNTDRFTGNIGVPLNDKAETRFYVTWNDIKQDLPGTLTKSDALDHPETAPAINILNDYSRDIRSLRFANRTAFELDNGLTIEAGGYVNDKSLVHPIFQVIDQDSLDTGLFGRLNGSYEMAGYANDFTLGLNTGHGVIDSKRFVNVQGERGALTYDAKQMAENIELYGENRFHFRPDWSFITGLQASWQNREYNDHLNAANDDDKIYQALNPKVGLLWDVDPSMQLYTSLTKSSEAPTYMELVQGAGAGFIPVDLQQAWTAEIGTRGERGAFSWDVTAYRAWVKDELLQFTVNSDIPASTFNADKTIHQGLEIGGGWQATRSLSFQAIYNLNDFTFDGDEQFGDNDLAGAPKHQIRLSARYALNGYYIEPNVEWVPEAAWVDYANTLKSDSYTVFGLKGGWEINQTVSIFLDARNLTDEKHITSFSTLSDARTNATNVFYPGEGRSVFGGMVVKF